MGQLTPTSLKEAMSSYRSLLGSHQEAINRLNVFPVPDGDTGTNMMLTVESVVRELEELGDRPSMAQVCAAIAHGSLMGARGNSGVILSQLLRGIAERLGALENPGATDLGEALAVGAKLAREAVVRPVEGTILTVADAAAEGAATGVTGDEDVLGVIEAAQRAASAALARTPEQLEALARAGVVDAGGAGYVLLFDALAAAVEGRALPAPAVGEEIRGATLWPEGPGDLRYEVMYLLEAPDDAIDAFKEVWAGIGDSIVVVGGQGLWNCHIHTDDVGAAIEAALDCGRPRNIRVTDLREQVEEERWVREGAPSTAPPAMPAPVTDVVAVVTGDGIARIFRSLGVHHHVVGGQSMNPSTKEILDAVESVEADQVVILPNNENIHLVAEQVEALTHKRVRVVATKSILEGFAALLAYDPGAGVADNEAAMRASAARVVSGEVTRAVRDANTEAGAVRAGDWIGVSRKGVLAVADSPSAAACALLGKLVEDGHELLTVIEGEGSTPGETRRITEWVKEVHPGMAVEVHHGGQPLYPYLFGIE